MMKTLFQCIDHLLKEAMQKAFPSLQAEQLQTHLKPATQEKFGHYQSNAAMKMTKWVQSAPREISAAIISHLDQAPFAAVEIAGPGFINLTLKPEFLSKLVDGMLKDPHLGVPPPEKKEKVVVEFSSPNIAKEMHVGHLRSTIIGDAIARLFEFLGHEVKRLNHVGDWGTAFGMLIVYMRENAPEAIQGTKEADLPTLMNWYRASKKCFDEDPSFKERARLAVVQLQGGDAEALKVWQTICEVSRRAFQEVYRILDIHLEERGESFYNPMLEKVVKDLENKGLVTVSEGAKCIFHEGMRIPLMVQKSDGGYNYDTTDMAAMLHRVEEEKADRIIVVTDAGQSLHFELVRKTAEQAGYLDPTKVHFHHVPFGVVLGPDGKKFKTRSGETEKLMDLLTAAVVEAKRILVSREQGLPQEELENLAQILGIDAVKYADLSCNRISDYVFSYERMLRFEGNTAAFLLYSYVRVNGIKRKVSGVKIEELFSHEKIDLTHPSEISLGLHLLRFSEALYSMEHELMPSHLSDYLYQLAQKFNAFFRDCRVEGTDKQNQRLLLCEAVACTLSQGLHILGIQTVDRM